MNGSLSEFRQVIIVVVFCLIMVNLTKPVLANGEYVVRVAQVQTDAYPEVILYIEVTDASGQQVTNLQQNDFQVTEDGQPVDVVDFAGVGDERPVDIVFVFDTTRSMEDEY